jgi:transposase, IS30 family
MTTRYRQLQPEERVTLASLLLQGHSLRSIAKALERSPSSLSRDVSRNGGADGKGSLSARQAALVRRVRSRPLPKQYADGALWHIVSHQLTWLCPPRQIARTLGKMWPENPDETIYDAIYAHPKDELRRALVSRLRQAQNTLWSRSGGEDRRG